MNNITTTVKLDCKHKNGWYHRIYFKKWFFTFNQLYFFCRDCEQPIEVDKKLKEL